MQQYERIAIWVLLIMITIRLFFTNRQMSYYTASSPVSLMDLKEFDGFHPEIKQLYQDNIVNKLAPTIGEKMARIWNKSENAKIKAAFVTGDKSLPEAVTKIRNNIMNMPDILPSA